MSASVSADDWQLVQAFAKPAGVDPYVLVAIGLFETTWGTEGEGRPPGEGGHGLILGVGAFDSGPDAGYGGLEEQLRVGVEILLANQVHQIADIRAGKLHTYVDAQGQRHTRWASGDVPPDWPWSSGVSKWWQAITGKAFTASTSTAWRAPGEDWLDMATQDEVKAAVKEAVSELFAGAVVPGQTTLGGTIHAGVTASQAAVNAANAAHADTQAIRAKLGA